jgi:hypothetical protein
MHDLDKIRGAHASPHDLENRLRTRDRSRRGAHLPFAKSSDLGPPWLSLAVTTQGGGRQRTKANLDGCLRTPFAEAIVPALAGGVIGELAGIAVTIVLTRKRG